MRHSAVETVDEIEIDGRPVRRREPHEHRETADHDRRIADEALHLGHPWTTAAIPPPTNLTRSPDT